jgi:HSP20 family molecular chaperone IbpA
VALHHRLRSPGRPRRQLVASRDRRQLSPYNIERSGEDDYRISLAVAGFGVNDITVTAEQNALTIEGSKPDGATREYLYQGIAARPFRRVFNLADYVQVKQASFRDGLLIIDQPAGRIYASLVKHLSPGRSLLNSPAATM